MVRKKFVFLCTNAVLGRKRWDRFDFQPFPDFAFTVHIDGLRERHDQSVCQEGVFDEAVEAIRWLKTRGSRVTTNSTFSPQPPVQGLRASSRTRRGAGHLVHDRADDPTTCTRSGTTSVATLKRCMTSSQTRSQVRIARRDSFSDPIVASTAVGS